MAATSLINKIIENLVKTATNLIVLLDIVALLVFIWGIIKFITASQDPQKIKEAKGILWWGVIAFFVLTSIFGLVLALQDYFGIDPEAPLTVPQFETQ